MFRELKREPLWKLKRERRNWRLVHVILPKAILAILTGVLIAMLILGVTEPREAVAETVPATVPDVVESHSYGPLGYIETAAVSEPDMESESETVAETDAPAETEPEMEYIGTFTLTAYCNCRKCCGKWAGGGNGVRSYAGGWKNDCSG